MLVARPYFKQDQEEYEIIESCSWECHLRTPSRADGVDWAPQFVSEDIPLIASIQGVITATGKDSNGGLYVDITYGTYMVRCVHLSKIDVVVGQHVHVGDIIGLMGTTGNSSGIHVHFEVWEQGRRVDPNNFGLYYVDEIMGVNIPYNIQLRKNGRLYGTPSGRPKARIKDEIWYSTVYQQKGESKKYKDKTSDDWLELYEIWENGEKKKLVSKLWVNNVDITQKSSQNPPTTNKNKKAEAYINSAIKDLNLAKSQL